MAGGLSAYLPAPHPSPAATDIHRRCHRNSEFAPVELEPSRPRPNTRPPTPPRTRTVSPPPHTATGLTRLSTVGTAVYVTREDICRQRKLGAFIFFSDATIAARRGVYHNNVECMRNELIPRHRLIENRRACHMYNILVYTFATYGIFIIRSKAYVYFFLLLNKIRIVI